MENQEIPDRFGKLVMDNIDNDAHTAIGMTHTGSVGQYKAFKGSGY